MHMLQSAQWFACVCCAVMAVTKKNANAMVILNFLYRLVEVGDDPHARAPSTIRLCISY